MEQSSIGKLDTASWKKIGIGALIASAGALLTYILSVITKIDFGAATPAVVSICSILVNIVRKWLTDYSANVQ